MRANRRRCGNSQLRIFVSVHLLLLCAWFGTSWGLDTLPDTMASVVEEVNTTGVSAVFPVQIRELTHGAVGTLQAATTTPEPAEARAEPTVVHAKEL